MVNKALAESYLKRCRIRVEILEEFLKITEKIFKEGKNET